MKTGHKLTGWPLAVTLEEVEEEKKEDTHPSSTSKQSPPHCNRRRNVKEETTPLATITLKSNLRYTPSFPRCLPSRRLVSAKHQRSTVLGGKEEEGCRRVITWRGGQDKSAAGNNDVILSCSGIIRVTSSFLPCLCLLLLLLCSPRHRGVRYDLEVVARGPTLRVTAAKSERSVLVFRGSERQRKTKRNARLKASPVNLW